MSLLVVALLSLLWLGFFLPSLLQARRTSSPYTSATTFQESLRRLGEVPHPKTPGAAPAGRPHRAAAAARRRETLAVLTAAVLAGVLLAVGFGGWATWAVLPPTAALVTYVVKLRLDVVRRSARRCRPNIAVRAVAEPAGFEPTSDGEDPGQSVADEPMIVPSVGRRASVSVPERIAG